jgi:putative addiction module killer protein
MFDGQPQEIVLYEKSDGTRPFEEWLGEIRDRRAIARIDARVTRLQGGNPGDYKSVGAGVYELRIDYGQGYRLYVAFAGNHLILLLLGGD